MGRIADLKGHDPMTDTSSPAFLKLQAQQFRRLAREITDKRTQEVLIQLADEYESRAVMVRAGDDCAQGNDLHAIYVAS